MFRSDKDYNHLDESVCVDLETLIREGVNSSDLFNV